ncbi:MAG: Gfo/Idh/MocA family oxidoreductase [Fuerstiella sp.]
MPLAPATTRASLLALFALLNSTTAFSQTPAAPAPSQRLSGTSTTATASEDTVIKVGMIGLDTSHCLAFAKVMNDADDPKYVPGCQITLVYPKGSPDIESSTRRVPQYTVDIQKLGVKVTHDLNDMIEQVDAVLLETNDGRPHLEQILPVLKAGKPCFIDKPMAASLTDCLAIFTLAEHYNTPVFSASSLRYGTNTQAVKSGSIGNVTGCDTYSPCKLEKTHPDLFWYGIHGVESLVTVMGPNIKSVTRTQTDNFDQVTGVWTDGRIGTFRGIRAGASGYGGIAFGQKKTSPVGQYDGYAPLVQKIATFFQSGKAPVNAKETIAIYAFMEAADESKRQNFGSVQITKVIQKAQRQANAKVMKIMAADQL